MDLREIVQSEEFILFDTGVITDTMKLRGTADRELTYADVDVGSYKSAVQSSQERMAFVSESRTRTVDEVIFEVGQFRDDLRSRQEAYNRRAQRLPPELGSSGEGKRVFDEFCSATADLIRKARRYIYRPHSDDGYEAFVFLLKSLRYNPKDEKPKKKNRLYTDEKLVAGAFDYVVSQGKSASILTKDKDIETLVLGLAASVGKGDIDSLAIQRIRDVPIRVYRSRPEKANYALTLDTTKYKGDPRLSSIPRAKDLRKKSPEQFAELRRAYPISA